MRTLPFLLLANVLLPPAFAQGPAPSTGRRQDRLPHQDSQSSLSFEPNRGQTGAAAQYFARTGNGILFFTQSGVLLAGASQATGFEFVNANAESRWEALEPSGHKVSYYVGRDPSKWVEGVEQYRRLERLQIYPGIDLVCYGQGDRLEYEFQLAPHSDPSRIRLHFTGTRHLSIAPDGALVAETADGPVRHESLVLYETLPDGSRRRVPGAYRLLSRNDAGFTAGKHNASLALSIDPILETSTYFGGSADDQVIVASSGAIIGNTTSIDFPGAAFSRRKGTNIFLQLAGFPYLNFGQTLIFGGSGNTIVTSAAPGLYGGTTVVGGYTDAPDLPTNISNSNPVLIQGLQGVWQPSFAGGATDGFVLFANLSGQRSSVILSYFGTPGDDRVTAVSNGSYSSFAIAGTTNGRGLPYYGAPSFQGVPSDQAAGLDGFLITGYGSQLSTFGYVTLSSTTYFGGSGDDTPLAVLWPGSNIYVAGETTSPDFPLANPLAPALNGASDAFLMEWMPDGATIAASTYFGGGGKDRGVQLGLAGDGSLMLAGVTSSSDLPVMNAAQATYGGGASDGFLAMFAPDLSAEKYATYIGGSGADETTSLATDGYGPGAGIYVGGWTASSDFPAKNAVQPQFGGGPDDGFVAHFDAMGSVLEATYFGGSGSDRVLSVSALGAGAVSIAGRTTSADLPTQNAAQPSLKGASDGFLARIGPSGFVTGPLSGGKDLRSSVTFYLGNPAVGASATVTIASSDPTKVQLAGSLNDPGQASIQVMPGQSVGEYPIQFYADCLDDNGGADLTLAASGYQSQTVQATCYPAAINGGYLLTNSVTAITNQVTTQVGAQPVVMYPTLSPAGPVQLFSTVAGVRPGASTIPVQITASNPAAGTVSPASVTLGTLSQYGSSAQATFTATAPGATDISFSAPGLAMGGWNPLHIVVMPPLTLPPTTAIPSGFQRGLGFSAARSLDQSLSLTVTSQDPNSLVLTTDPTQTGTGSVTVPLPSASRIWAQALAPSGDIAVTSALPGFDPITTTVHISAPVFYFPNNVLTQPFVLGVGETISLGGTVGTSDPRVTCCFAANPGTPGQVSLAATNSDAVTVSPPTAIIGSSLNSYSAGFQVTGVAEGSAALNLQPPQGIPLAPNYRPVSLTVKKKPMLMPDLELGKDLSAVMTLTLPTSSSSALPVHLAVNNPALALLSADGNAQGQQQMDATIPANVASLRFYVYGLAATGTAQVTATVSGKGAVTANVILEPSGFGWNTDSYTGTLYTPGGGSTPAVVAFVLDPATMLPVWQEDLRPSATASVPIVNANPDIVSISPSSFSFPIKAGNSIVQITAKSAGNATLSITQPAGFSAPAIRQQLAVTIQQPTISVYSNTPVGKNLEAPLQTSVAAVGVSQSLPVTVTSSDPSRLLVAPDANTPGSASITVNFSDRNGINLQALDDHGSVTVTVSAPTFNTGTVQVSLAPAGIGISVNVSSGYPPTGSTMQNGQYFTTTQSPNTVMTPAIYIIQANGQPLGANQNVRPGVGPLLVNFTSSNANVGTITNSTLTLVSTNYGQPTTGFAPVGVGKTDITVSQPAGFVPVPGLSTLSFNVTAPGFAPAAFVLGKDMFTQSMVNLPANVSASQTNVTVTLTSSDPTQVLLSADAGSAPGGTLTVTLVAGKTVSSPFYIHALGNSGMVTIAVTASGYADGTINITLADTTFAFSNYLPGQTILQSGPKSLTVYPMVVLPNGLSQGSPYGTMIRPGAAPITVTVASSDPSTVSVDNPQIVFNAGASSASFMYRPLQVGQATLSLTVPPGYAQPGAGGQLTITVTASSLNFAASGVQLGRDLQSGLNIGATEGFHQPTTLTVTSGDPSRLLLSADGKSPGAGSVTITAPANGGGFVYMQALSDNGTVNVSVSSDGYHPGTLPIALVPSAAVFSGGSSQLNLLTNAGQQQLTVGLVELDPVSLQPRFQLPPRPGANLSVTLTSSDAKVIAVDTPSVQFNAANPSSPQSVTAMVRPVGVGTAVLSLGLLPGGGTPASGGQLLVNVTEPALSIPAFALGLDLEGPLQIKIASALPTPTSSTTVTVSSNYPVGLSNTASGSAQFSIMATFDAGQRLSEPFYVHGLGAGTAGLYSSGNLFGQSLSGSQSTSVGRTAFIFKEASQPQPAAMKAGSSGSFTVLPAVSPLTSAAPTPLSIRTNAAPIFVSVTSSNPNVLAVTTPQVTLHPGDTQATVGVQAMGTGQATLTLSGTTAYDFGTAQSTLTVAVQ
jgi:hypothetical protein